MDRKYGVRLMQLHGNMAPDEQVRGGEGRWGGAAREAPYCCEWQVGYRSFAGNGVIGHQVYLKHTPQLLTIALASVFAG